MDKEDPGEETRSMAFNHFDFAAESGIRGLERFMLAVGNAPALPLTPTEMIFSFELAR